MAEVPAELVRMLDEDASKVHSADGPVLASLARILERHEQMVREQFVAELAELGIRIVPKTVDDLWDCPSSPSRGQRAHNFGDLGQPSAKCLNGCGMTWARLQEAAG